MRFFYTLGIYLLSLVLQVFSLFNQKLKLGVIGRRNTFSILKKSISKTDKTIWMHCASLGEYEQGLPVLLALRRKYPDYKLVVSFFSPSGYENKKDSKDFDVAVYLHLDTPKNVKQFLDLIHPKLILFVKYEIWPNFLLEAKNRNIQTILISAVFRKNQSYFKWYGSLMRKALFTFEHIFTQEKNSKTLLQSINYKAVSVAGDTRFDRVYKQLEMDNTVSFIKTFTGKKTTLVFGSSWPADDSLFIPFINQSKSDDVKFIIAPHNINANYIHSVFEQLKVPAVKFSEMKGKNLSEYKVFILDTIGYLGRVFSYANIAYIGGAVGKTGLHNILEPAVFGVPIIIGKNFEKFPEAKLLIEKGGVISVKNKTEFETYVLMLIKDENRRLKLGKINSDFIQNNKGAVHQIIDYISL